MLATPEDRGMCVRPDQTVGTGWVSINDCKLCSTVQMSFEAVEKSCRRLIALGDCAPWPPIVGHWDGDVFIIDDGRHEFIASMIAGRTKVFVCWLRGDVDRYESVIEASVDDETMEDAE